ncbi:MAG: copper amine oxidase N-terminal domain-containing protein [Dehalobacterium sp.]
MKQLRTFPLLFAFLLMSMLLSGCSKTEREFYALQKECANLNTYVNTGEVSFSINQLPEDITEGLTTSQKMLFQLLTNLNLSYEQKVDKDRQLFATSVYLRLTESASPLEIISIICKDKVVYIKVDELAKFLKPFLDQEFSPFLDGVDGKKYLSISETEILTFMQSENTSMQNNTLEHLWDMDKINMQQTLYYSLLEGLMNNVYDEYETGIVEKNGNKFSITLSSQEIIDLIKPFLVYSIKHINELDDFLISTVENLSDEEMEMLDLDPSEREIYLQSITEVINQVKLTGPELLSQWDESEQMVAEMINKTVGDSRITSSIQKTGTTTYDSEVELLLQIKDEEETGVLLEISFNIKDSIKKSSGFKITAPTSDLITLTDFQAKFPLVMKLQPNYGFYTFNHGLISEFSDLDSEIENNHTYVPMRQVAEQFNEKIGWDNAKRQAYVERDQSRIYFNGIIKDDCFFVPVKEFEKIGLKIDWDPLTGTVTLIKQ